MVFASLVVFSLFSLLALAPYLYLWHVFDTFASMNNNPTGSGGFKIRKRYAEADKRASLRASLRKEIGEEIYILGTFHAANVFFYANFISKFLKKHKLTHRTYQLIVYIYILGKTEGSEQFFHPSHIPIIFGSPSKRVVSTLRNLRTRGILYAQQVKNPSTGYNLRCYQLTDEGKKLVHSFSREYKASITAYELTHGDILWAEINKDFHLYK